LVLKAIDKDGKAIDWFTVAADEWDAKGSTIQTRILVISNMKENETSSPREAYIYALPKAAAANFDFKSEDAASYYVATVKQYTAPATISIDESDFDATTTKFATASSELNFWFTEGALSDILIGNRYDISYYGADAKWGSENHFIASRAIDSFEYYAYNATGSFVKLSEEDSWVTASTFGGNLKFSISVDTSMPSFAASVFELTGEAEAVILVKYTDGTNSGIYFHYKEESEAATEATLTYSNMAMEEIAFESVEGNGWPYNMLPEANEYYSLTFGGWQFDDTSFKASKTIGAITTFTIWGGDMAERAETWFTPTVFGADDNMFKVSIEYDGQYATHADAANAWNSDTGMLDAAMYIQFTDGTSAVIYMQYNESGAVAGGGSLLSFAYPMYAPMEGSALTELTSGDFYDFAKSEFGAAAVWELTYTTTSPTMSMVTGFDESWTIFQKSDWINFEFSEGGSAIQMNSTETNTGYIAFTDGSGCPLVLICTIVLE
jgi:hypothetical protein